MTRRWMAVLAPVAWGLGAGLWTPRGPLTAAEALWSLVISALVGGLAGWAARSRWAMAYAPALFVAAFEIVRIPVAGPSVDGPHASPFGLVALLSGRGVHGVLAVLPMVVGAAYGAAVGRPATSWWRRIGTGAVAAALVVVAVAVALPARTPPIPGGVAALVGVDAGGYRLGVLLRGRDVARPVLLVVPGAPGGMEIGSMRRLLAPLEQHFVVATLDRRGGGGSSAALDADPPVSLASGVADILAVANYLRNRFGQDRIYLVAASGGSLLGALAAARHPELFRAYVGVGQAVHLPTTDRILYSDVLAWARRTGDAAVERQLVAQGPPPYPDFWSYEPIMTHQASAYAYDRTRNAEGEAGAVGNVNVPEYTLLEKLHTLNALMDSWQAQYPDMQQVDLRTEVPRLTVPAYFVQGAHEMRGLAEPFAEWQTLLDAPRKRTFVFDTSGHRPMFEQPTRFIETMTQIAAETGA
ncbi:alpha/beta hydrolase [Asanoa sp. WMMD1127]|uniref:alpha/beta fold hydrolase n=1 Tax=Asanoa sp. WMMD1127 TaxID=3016107 RepID=UPI00241649C2|nr:alpha/beta hydrolase [Asanoa sp. WMMD1127]MDG4826470.1 alpha/beta hydrolase [Asanoa sp. WMMD1127]